MAKIQKNVDEISDHAPREASEPDPTNFVYTPSNQLPDPKPRPGYRFGWIRFSVRGEADQGNVSAMTKDGWRPVPADSVPELSGMKDQYAPGPLAQQGFVEHRGNVLCVIPEYMAKARDEYYENLSRQAVRSISGKAREYGGDDSLKVGAKIIAGRGPLAARNR